MVNRYYQDKSPSDLLKSDPREARRFLDSIPLPERVQFIMLATAKERQELVLLSSNSDQLVSLFPTEEFFLTIKEIGAYDALSLISLASPEQLQFAIDIDWWKKDALDPEKAFEWLQVLFACGEDRVASWLNSVDCDLLVTVFKDFVAVFKLDEEEDRLEQICDFPSFSVDGYYFIRFKRPGIQEIVGRLVEILREINPKLYFDLMESIIWDIQAEKQEDAYRWRGERLSDFGVPTFHEALEIYKAPAIRIVDKVAPSSLRIPVDDGSEEEGIVPVFPLAVNDQPVFLLQTLEALTNDPFLDIVRRQWAQVCNYVVVADIGDFDNLRDVRKSVQKASRYLNIGLQFISRERPEKAKELIKTVPLVEIFRFGFDQAAALKRKGLSIIRNGHVAKDLSPADEPWRSVLDGVTGKYPLYYDPANPDKETGEEFRDFARLDEIRETEEKLGETELVAALFHSRFPDFVDTLRNLSLKAGNLFSPVDITWSVMLFTAFGQGLLHKNARFRPITPEELNAIFPLLWKSGKTGKARKLSRAVTKGIENILLEGYDIPQADRERIYRFLSAFYKRIEEEMGALSAPIDPRFIRILLVDM
ncbi:MAG: DUF6178 family protein [Pseudomonadota bacterium]